MYNKNQDGDSWAWLVMQKTMMPQTRLDGKFPPEKLPTACSRSNRLPRGADLPQEYFPKSGNKLSRLL